MSSPEQAWDARRVVLTPEAARFLALVRELGHLGPEQERQLLEELSPQWEAYDDRAVVLDRQEIRRLTASWLFREQLELDRDQLVLLAREWALLFG